MGQQTESIGAGRKKDFTVEGLKYVRGTYVTVAMEENVPLEFAEIRVYGSEFAFLYEAAEKNNNIKITHFRKIATYPEQLLQIPLHRW